MNQSKDPDNFSHIYGPVPSRRLGFSLGIDIIPFKTCSFNCIYCQLGPTSKKTIKRNQYFPSPEILSQIKKVFSAGQQIDYLTFSGSGEPTLNPAIGKLISKIKETSSIPVAVLTNSSLFTLKSVRKALQVSDLVIPSLDAATQDVFIKINRPHPLLKIEKIIEGLKEFRRKFKGSIWLEIMLVKGINDSDPHIRKLKQAIAVIQPEKVQLNTVIRPPAEKFALSLSLEELERVKNILGKKCEIIAEFNRKEQSPPVENLERVVFSLIQRRPVTLTDIAASLGKPKNEITKYLNFLLEEGKVKTVAHKGLKYYEPS